MLSTVLMSLAMAALTLVAGWIPFYMPATIDLAQLSHFSAGVILGTAFALVLPECYESFQEATVPGLLILLGFLLMITLQVLFSPEAVEHGAGAASGDGSGESANTAVELKNPATWFRGISMSALGMTIHAAADGIALGVTNGSSQALVFVAIVLHKAPAAFGLTALLLAQHKHSTDRIKRDVVLFSLAGPVLAILLAGVTTLLQGSAGNPEKPGVFAAACLALSGGTFVYVAVHVLEHAKSTSSGLKPVLTVGAGTILPVLASFLHD